MSSLSRRSFFTVTTATAGAGVLSACGASSTGAAEPRPAPWRWREDEAALLRDGRSSFEVVVRGGENAAVLRARAREVPPELDLTDVAARMEHAMRAAEGVGIAGPQVGLGLRVATLMLDYRTEHPHVIFVRNPVIAARSDETVDGYEGCLSVPGVGGLVRRNRWVKLRYQDLHGEPREAEAEEHNAVLWQHELDHLDGVLYVDRLLGELLPMEEVRRRRREAEEKLKATPPNVLGPGRAPVDGETRALLAMRSL